MWFKLEDANLNLYRTHLDFNWRATTPPASKRDRFEKIMYGGGSLCLIVMLLLGPLAFVVIRQDFPAQMTHGTLEIALEGGFQRMMLYEGQISRFADEAPPAGCSQINGLDHRHMFFQTYSNTLFMQSAVARRGMAANLDGVAKLRFTARVETNTWKYGVKLERPEAMAFQKCLNITRFQDLGQYCSIELPNMLRVSATNPSTSCPPLSIKADLVKQYDDNLPPHWVFTQVSGEHLWMFVPSANEASSHSAKDEKGGTNDITLSAMYVVIFGTIAKLLRMVFKDSSTRIFVEELPDTSLLMELCDGIYLARTQKNIEVEWQLYHELIRIFRSPELLTLVTNPRGAAAGHEACTRQDVGIREPLVSQRFRTLRKLARSSLRKGSSSKGSRGTNDMIFDGPSP
eukprot:CAMPEP_0117547238 /NCGR_PEP_ID=MMETSP0784-20121206/47023_1 /TAXON_ID=39447 /ORGANISM="" /LENGTH=400 /DNA_ID=CAMNT_0005344141 /DNA_START=1 /DNA_END=1203 /DNA_ORIENTATION=-